MNILKTHRYLNRISVTILLLVFVPAVILSFFIWRRAYRDVKNSNQVYYEQVVRSFGGDFEERLSALQTHAISIAVDSKTDKSIFHEGLKSAQTHPIWYYRAVQQMQEQYPHYDASYCGVYYYDIDRIVSVSGVSPVKYYLYSLDIRDPEHRVWSFFDPENYVPGSWIFGSTYVSPARNSYILAGYCTELGKDRDKVMIFYTLSRDDYAGLQTVVYEQSGINFRILDPEGQSTYMFIGDEAATDGTVYSYPSRSLPLNYEILVTGNSVALKSDTLYGNPWIVPTILTVILAATCIISVAIVYRPVRVITAELGSPEPVTDEFGNIRYVLNERNSTIMEQDNLILDLLLKHLIHGVPVNQRAIERLGVARDMDHYCVFLLSGYLPTASETERLAEQIEQNAPARLFCTDLQGGSPRIFILFLRGGDVGPVAAQLERWLRERGGEEALLVQGTVTEEMDGIRGSFLSSMEKLKELQLRSLRDADESTVLPAAPQEPLEKQILNYLDLHFREPELSQVQVADAFRISTYTLSRLFKNQVGIGFAEYVNTRRLEYAKILLQTTALPIKEIAAQCGYASESYFGRIFKATFGVSPSAFKDR